MKWVRAAWWAWGVAAMLFFSGTRAPLLIVLCVLAGFALLVPVLLQALSGRRR